MNSRARTLLTTTLAAATITAGPLATGAAADEACVIDPRTKECAPSDPIDDGTFFSDTIFIPGSACFPDSVFDEHNPNSGDIVFPEDNFLSRKDNRWFDPTDAVAGC